MMMNADFFGEITYDSTGWLQVKNFPVASAAACTDNSTYKSVSQNAKEK
jgi:hypothetical protein